MSEYGLIANARTRPDATALICGDERRTYAELDDRARRVAHVLSRLGVGPDDRIALMLPNSIAWLEALHGAGRLGAVTVPINPTFKRGETSWLVGDSGAKVVVTRSDLVDRVGDQDGAQLLLVDDGYEEALAEAPDGDVEIAGAGWPVTMAYTSGTTGRPKGIALGQTDFRRTPDLILEHLNPAWMPTPDDVHLVAGPMYHSAALFFANVHLAVGATNVIMEKYDAGEALRLIEDHGVTTAQMVPAHFVRILGLPDEVRDAADTSSLRLVLHAGAPCPVDVKRRTMELFDTAEIWEYFAASEGGGTSIGPDEWLAHPGSVGKPIGDIEVKIVGPEGQTLPPGEPGVIYSRTGHMSFAYHNDPDKTQRAYDDEGWFTVGDVGYLDEDGYVYLTGRASDMLITGGINVYPAEIEEVLHEHPDIVDVAVLGVPDERWGEAIAAVVQRRPGSDLDEDGVVSWVRDNLADYKRPRIVRFVDELPRTEAGKVRKHVLRDDLATGAVGS